MAHKRPKVKPIANFTLFATHLVRQGVPQDVVLRRVREEAGRAGAPVEATVAVVKARVFGRPARNPLRRRHRP